MVDCLPIGERDVKAFWAFLVLALCACVAQFPPPAGAESPAAAPPAAVAAAGLCGDPVAKAGGGYWTCVGTEHFSGAELNRSLWTPLSSTGKGTTEACNRDSPQTVAVSNGTLRLTVQRATSTLRCPVRWNGTRARYVSGSVSTHQFFNQQYGRFEARIKATPTNYPGLQESFWLWPVPGQDNLTWPAAGEIDISETYSQHPNLSIPFLHYGSNDNGGPVAGLNTAWHCTAARGEFHTYTLEWTADQLAIYVDGAQCLVNTAGASSFRKRFFIALTQLIGQGGNAYDGRAPLPATMYVDYVRIWQ